MRVMGFIDRMVLEALRESGTSMTASELAFEAELDINSSQRALSRLLELGKVSERGFGVYEAREPSGSTP
jgi:DNA-binding IclR family transcriptional regulator